MSSWPVFYTQQCCMLSTCAGLGQWLRIGQHVGSQTRGTWQTQISTSWPGRRCHTISHGCLLLQIGQFCNSFSVCRLHSLLPYRARFCTELCTLALPEFIASCHFDKISERKFLFVYEPHAPMHMAIIMQTLSIKTCQTYEINSMQQCAYTAAQKLRDSAVERELLILYFMWQPTAEFACVADIFLCWNAGSLVRWKSRHDKPGENATARRRWRLLVTWTDTWQGDKGKYSRYFFLFSV